MKKKILSFILLMCLVGIPCILSGCSADNIQIPTDYNVNVTSDEKYVITVINDSDSGKIYPILNNEISGVEVDKNDSYTFTIKANEGYSIQNLLIDGQIVPAQEVYTFLNIDRDHTICAIYSKINNEQKKISKLNLIGIEASVWTENVDDYNKDFSFYGGFALYQDKRIEDKDYLFEDDLVRIWGTDTWKFKLFSEADKEIKCVAIDAENKIVVSEQGNIVLQTRGNDGGGEGYKYNIDVKNLIEINNEYYKNLFEYNHYYQTSDGEHFEITFIFEVEYDV